MNRFAQFLSRLWVVLTLIWWAVVLVVLLSNGARFSLDEWLDATAKRDKFCHYDAPKDDASFYAHAAQCRQAVDEIGQLSRDLPNPHFIFSSFKQRAELTTVILGPPLLIYALGAALVWACRPLAKGGASR
jgi:hypothetical protein